MQQLDDGIWQIEELLSPSECVPLIAKAESMGFSIARMQNKGRNNRETFLNCSETIQMLCYRLAAEVSQEKSADFQIVRLGEILEIYRYQQGEFLTPHCDAPKEIEPCVWSSHTLVIYLSDKIQGGDTVFPKRGIRVSPQCGKTVLFKHSILHEVAEVFNGTKYISRTDV